MQIKATKEGWYSDAINLYGFEKREGFIDVIDLPTIRSIKREEGMPINALPFLRLTTDQAQALMDSLWDCGVKPSEGTGSAGSLAATERHLKDMQDFAKQLLGDKLNPVVSSKPHFSE